MAIVVDVISQLENYAITKEALEVLKTLFSTYFIIMSHRSALQAFL